MPPVLSQHVQYIVSPASYSHIQFQVLYETLTPFLVHECKYSAIEKIFVVMQIIGFVYDYAVWCDMKCVDCGNLCKEEIL